MMRPKHDDLPALSLDPLQCQLQLQSPAASRKMNAGKYGLFGYFGHRRFLQMVRFRPESVLVAGFA